jgi:nitroimidazol reductase NimA-like FMN-containing flavoprotein (pyridoxamine 5'-phosphate oxidase superfamily)
VTYGTPDRLPLHGRSNGNAVELLGHTPEVRFDIDRLKDLWLARLAPATRATYVRGLQVFAEFVGTSTDDAVRGLLSATPGEAYELCVRYRSWLETTGVEEDDEPATDENEFSETVVVVEPEIERG